jgi:hypothetical protein
MTRKPIHVILINGTWNMAPRFTNRGLEYCDWRKPVFSGDTGHALPVEAAFSNFLNFNLVENCPAVTRAVRVALLLFSVLHVLLFRTEEQVPRIAA